jgi:hypothetical protein
MDLHMQSHRLTQRRPDWRAASYAGLIAGLVFLVLVMLGAAINGPGVWWPARMAAAILMGQNVLVEPGTFDFAVALVALIVHFALSVIFGLILALIMAPFVLDSSWGMATLAGVVFGLLLYIIDFYGFTALFPWFAAARGAGTLLLHLLFGIVAADSYRKLERPLQSGMMPSGPA